MNTIKFCHKTFLDNYDIRYITHIYFALNLVKLHGGSVARWFGCTVVQLHGGSVVRLLSYNGSVAWGSVTRLFSGLATFCI